VSVPGPGAAGPGRGRRAGSQPGWAPARAPRDGAPAALTGPPPDAPAPPSQPDAPLVLSSTSGSIATLVWQIACKENALEKVQDELAQVSERGAPRLGAWVVGDAKPGARRAPHRAPLGAPRADPAPPHPAAQMVEVFATQPKLRELALDPFVPRVARVKIMQDLLKDSGATEITKRLFASLAEENALAATLQISNAFDELMLAHRKEVYCTIVTAEPMDKLEKVEMTKQAAQFVEPGFKLVMKEKVNKKLLGGFVLEFEDRLVDMSVAKKLEEFNNLVFKLEADLRV
jgi:F-type H+-transporting ATPase subunit O